MMVLFLNDISGSEVLLILVFVLMFFGSKSIPGLARTLGKTMRQIKDASNDLQDEIRKSGADMKKDLNLDGLMEDTARDIQQPLDQYVSDLEDAVSYQPPSRTQIQTPSSTTASNEDEVTPVQESEIIDVNVDVVPSQQSDPTETPKQ
jgi:TatA/E family protein of Tat protein translocase